MCFVINHDLPCRMFSTEGHNLLFVCRVFTVTFSEVFFIFIKVSKGKACFHFPKSGAYLTSSDTENGLSGLSGDPTVGELYDLQSGSESDWNVTGGGVKVKGKKKLSAKDIVSSDVLYFFFSFPPEGILHVISL